jgi:NCS1 family nucleobase:cation symporter-1
MSTHLGHDSISPTQDSERNLGVSGTFFLWLAATLVIPTIMTGQMFIPDIDPFSAFEAVFIASTVGCIALAAIALIGNRTGLPTLAIARATYGQNGAKLVALTNIIILMGWCLIQGYLGGLALNQVLNALLGIDNILLSIFITQGLVVSIAILGHTGIQRIEGIASSMMLIVALAVIYSLLHKYDLADLEGLPLSDSPALTYAIVFDIVLATAFSWMSLPCDYNRYCKSTKVSTIGITSGYLIGTLIAMGLGIGVGAFSIIEGVEPTYDPSALLGGSFGVAAAIVMFLSVLTTNVMVVYSCVMSAMSIQPKARYIPLTLVIGALCLAGSFLQDALMTSFFDWVLLVGALFIPIFAIILTDYFLVKRSDYDVEAIIDATNPKYQYTQGFNIPAVISYIAGAGFAFYFTYISPLEFGSTAATFVASMLIYYVMSRLFSHKATACAASAS